MQKFGFAVAALIATAVLGAACGGGDGSAATATHTATKVQATPTEPGTQPQQSPSTQTPTEPTHDANVVVLEIASLGEEEKFDKAELIVSAGAEVVLRYKNSSTTLEHNWVLVELNSKDDVAFAGMRAGPENNWIPQGDDRVLAQMRLLGPGEAEEIRFAAPGPGKYQFVCTYPAHNDTMFGSFEVAP